MIVVERGDVEAVLFWVGACAFFLCDPFLSVYVFHDFVPHFKGFDRTPREIAVMGAMVNGPFMFFPTLAFWVYGRSLQYRKKNVALRPMAPALAVLFGLMTGALLYHFPRTLPLIGELLPLIACMPAAVASSSLIWRTLE